MGVTDGPPWTGAQSEAAGTEVLGSALASCSQVGLWRVWRACGWGCFFGGCGVIFSQPNSPTLAQC